MNRILFYTAAIILFLFPCAAFAQTRSAQINRKASEPKIDEKEFARFFAGRTAAFVLLDVKRNKYYRFNKKVAAERLPPCSTFKIPNALIGLETGIVPDAEFVIKWDGKKRPIAPWNKDHNLRSAMTDSVLWYFVDFSRKVGQPRYDEYLKKLDYGNKDASGGIETPFWLSSSLKISADEQIEFLKKLHEKRLPFSARSHEIVLDILKLSEENNVVFRGKTGTAGDPVKDIATLGWFVGSLTERDGRLYIFAANIRGGENPSGRTARGITEKILSSLNLM
jgi:beta-lactamase class D